MKKILMILMLALFCVPWVTNAQVQIGTGDATNSYVPSYSYYNYSVTQQIYTADEINASGTITSIAFYNGGSARARQYNIYMAHTDKTVFDNTSDWIDLTGNLVYEGTAAVTMTAGAWTTFTLDVPFAYNGTDNLVVGVLDLTGSWESGLSCLVFDAAGNQALYKYQDAGAYGIDGTYNDAVVSGTLLTKKNQIILGGIQQAYPTPMDLACTGMTANSATLSWTEIGTATSWQICLDDDETNLIPANTNPFTVEGLTAEQTYTAKVRACYDGNHYSSWSGTTTFTPTAKIVIGSGTATNSYLPTYIYYKNSLTQQIYTPAELGEGGVITSIDFYCTADNTYARNFDIYMVSTSKDNFTSTTDWITVTTDNLVYSGEVTLTAGWNTFELDGFEYDGTSNVAIIVDAHAENYQSGPAFYVYDAPSENQAIHVYNDNTNYDPFAPSSYTGTLVSVKNQLRLLKEPLPPCSKPTGFAVTDVTNHTATLSWTSNASAWQICLNDDEENLIPVTTNPYTLTGLDAETFYSVKLRANCGGADGVSNWTGVTFTTEIACPAPTALTVVPVDPNAVTVTWNGTANGYEMEYANVAGGVSGLNTFAFDEDLEGWTNLIVNADQGEWIHSSENQGGYDYTQYVHGGTGFAMCYSFVDYVGSYETDAYLVSPINYAINAGATMNFWYDMANDSYPEYFEVCVATVANPTAEDFTAIWSFSESKSMGDPARKVSMGSSDMRHINRTRSDNWREVTIDLSDYVGQSIWIAFHDVNTDAYEVWIDDVTINAGTSSEITWIPVGTVTSPYTLNGLQEGTPYLLRVRAVCGGIDGESVWLSTNFTTPTFCDAPFELEVPFETLMPTTATLTWEGYQDSYEVRYRIPQVPYFEEGFENGIPSTWTTINNDTTNLNDWFALSDIMDIYSYYTSIPDWAHSGSNAALSASYANGAGAWATNQYLVTPQLDLQGTLKFYAKSTYTSPDSFEVLLSTTGTNIADFTITLQEMGAATYNSFDEVSIDLSDYAGQQGYIAIHHVSTDKYFLVIDDFGLYELAGDDDWITVPADAEILDIENLAPETEYEWQVRGVNANCDGGFTDWTVGANFTTPGLCDPFAEITIDELTATSITVSWLGYQESYNLRYRTTGSADEIFYDDFSGEDLGWTNSNLNEDEEQPSDFYSLSFTDGSSMNVFGFAGNGEDQYLISPEIEGVVEGTTLEFMYLAYEASTQTFQVGFSSTDDELTSFTWGDAFTNGTDDYYDYYEVAVPAGTKYFAIKSSGEENLLLLGDFYMYANYVPNGEWITVEGITGNSYTINGLTPETDYELRIQGVCGEGETTAWEGGYFTTPELTTLTQTIALSNGTNWVSFYVETNLDDLKAALVAAVPGTDIKIQDQNNNTKYNPNNGRWSGRLNTLDVAYMYMITVASDCEITLEGSPINPADHPVEIKNGATWIGFPLTENMTPANAFAGFAVAGDKVQSQSNNASYNGSRWSGRLTTLEPGKGYIYHSQSEMRVLTFPGVARR